jgi:hypothetical protein
MSGLKRFALISLLVVATASAFQVPMKDSSRLAFRLASRDTASFTVYMSQDDGVVELAEDEAKEEEPKSETAVAPFLSQGEVSEEPMDLSDPKQARVAIYIILSLIPVLFLLPLMLGSRELIPLEMIPPVDM